MNKSIVILPLAEWRAAMSDYWKVEASTIPVFNNPFGIIQIPRERWHLDILFVPMALKVEDRLVAYTSVMNISDTVIRTRGLYVPPHFRGKGFGPYLMRWSWMFFPPPFYRAVEFFKDPDFFVRKGMHRFKEQSPFWSNFSATNLTLLYKDFGHKWKDLHKMDSGRRFIEQNRSALSLGGSNNLNVNWDEKRWSEYFDTHAGNYEPRIFDLEWVDENDPYVSSGGTERS